MSACPSILPFCAILRRPAVLARAAVRRRVEKQSPLGSPVSRILAVFVGNVVIAAPSHAYLDPGTGSVVLQSLLAGIAVAIGVLRLYWYRLKGFLTGLIGPRRENPQCEPDRDSSSPGSDSGAKDHA